MGLYCLLLAITAVYEVKPWPPGLFLSSTKVSHWPDIGHLVNWLSSHCLCVFHVNSITMPNSCKFNYKAWALYSRGHSIWTEIISLIVDQKLTKLHMALCLCETLGLPLPFSRLWKNFLNPSYKVCSTYRKSQNWTNLMETYYAKGTGIQLVTINIVDLGLYYAKDTGIQLVTINIVDREP